MYVNPYSNEEFFFFWGGPFSQWAKRDMVIRNVKFNCCEQWMMAQKAATFQDEEIFLKIMAETDPKEQKALGRKVRGFDKEIWDSKLGSRLSVFRGNYAKFSQNDDMLDELRSTGGRTVVEASPYDRVWGIGLEAKDPKAKVPEQWQGKNWLGKYIMEVRETLRKQGKF